MIEWLYTRTLFIKPKWSENEKYDCAIGLHISKKVLWYLNSNEISIEIQEIEILWRVHCGIVIFLAKMSITFPRNSIFYWNFFFTLSSTRKKIFVLLQCNRRQTHYTCLLLYFITLQCNGFGVYFSSCRDHIWGFVSFVC